MSDKMPRTLGKCPGCGNTIITSKTLCQEIAREAVWSAELAARDLERDADFRSLPIGTKLKSKRTGNTVEIAEASTAYTVKHLNDVSDSGDDFTTEDWEELKSWYDVTELTQKPPQPLADMQSDTSPKADSNQVDNPEEAS